CWADAAWFAGETRALGTLPVGGASVWSTVTLVAVQPARPPAKSSENSVVGPLATVMGAEAADGSLVFVPSDAVTVYVCVLPAVSPVSANDTVVVLADVTVPTAVGAPSRNTAYLRDVARSSLDAAHDRSMRPDIVLVPLGRPGIVGGVVSGG